MAAQKRWTGGKADSSVIVFVRGWGETDKGIPEWYRLFEWAREVHYLVASVGPVVRWQEWGYPEILM